MTNLVNVLKTLNTAYPRNKLDADSVRVYIKSLSDIPGHVLEIAVDNIIKDSKWFPSVAELRAESQRVANLPSSRDFRSVDAFSANQLLAEREGLFTAFYADRVLDAAAWTALADKFERTGRTHRSEHTRKTLETLKAIEEAEHATA